MSAYEQWVALLTLMRKEIQALHPDLDADSVAFSHHYVTVLSDLWQLDWSTYWSDGRRQLHGVCGAWADHDVDCHQLLRQCGVVLFWFKV